MNEGLEKLGEKEVIGGITYEGYVFAGSAIEKIKIPFTLKIIEKGSFS